MKTITSLLVFSGSLRQMFSLLSLASLMTTAPAAQPAIRAEELLERGIHSEEARGDLDAAISVYQQIVSDAKSQAAIAAEAQYRLAVCLFKKGQRAEAADAFAKLAKDYPDQKELVGQAKAFLANSVSLEPIPWKDGEYQRFVMKFPSGKPLGVAQYTADLVERDGRKAWLFGSNFFVGVRQWSRAYVDAASFAPIESRWKHTMVGNITAAYQNGKAVVHCKGQPDRGPFELEPGVYDNEQAIPVIRRLPLADGYTGRLAVFAAMGLGGNGQVLPLEVKVSGPTKLQVPAGTFDCYRVDTNIMQVFWVSADENRYLVKLEAGGVVGELVRAGTRSSTGESDHEVGDKQVHITAPNDWLVEAHPEKATAVTLIDAEGTGVGATTVRPVSKLGDEKAQTLRAFADSRMREAGGRFGEFKIVEGSWTESTVSGHPALFVEADMVEGKAPHRFCAMFTIANGKAVDVAFVVPKEDHAAFQPTFERIAKTVKISAL